MRVSCMVGSTVRGCKLRSRRIKWLCSVLRLREWTAYCCRSSHWSTNSRSMRRTSSRWRLKLKWGTTSSRNETKKSGHSVVSYWESASSKISSSSARPRTNDSTTWFNKWRLSSMSRTITLRNSKVTSSSWPLKCNGYHLFSKPKRKRNISFGS